MLKQEKNCTFDPPLANNNVTSKLEFHNLLPENYEPNNEVMFT